MFRASLCRCPPAGRQTWALDYLCRLRHGRVINSSERKQRVWVSRKENLTGDWTPIGLAKSVRKHTHIRLLVVVTRHKCTFCLVLPGLGRCPIGRRGVRPQLLILILTFFAKAQMMFLHDARDRTFSLFPTRNKIKDYQRFFAVCLNNEFGCYYRRKESHGGMNPGQ